MHITRQLSALIALAAAMTMAVPTRAADEAALIAVITSADASKADKAITCKKLAVFGSKDAVPALAKLLNDEQLISWAHIALEAIPGPEADEALRKAMGTLKGRSLVGVINSIGVRRDTKAVAALTERLKDNDEQVAVAAAAALGKIGDETATKTLRASLAGGSDAVRSAVAEGCISCAERLLAAGKASDAAAIYEQVRTAKVPKQRVIEATRGAILAQGDKGIPLLVEQLRSKDKRMFRIGLQTARELPGKSVADAVSTEMASASPERGALLLLILADRGDATASPAVLKIAKSGSKPTRIAAIRVLASSASAASVPLLFDIAAEEDAEIAAAAKSALINMPGKKIDAQVVERLNKAQGTALLALVELVGQRRVEATPALLKAADSSDEKLRTAALAALGETIKQKDIRVLIARVTSNKKAADQPSALKALRAACVRMPDGEACAAELTSAMASAPTATQVALLDIFGEMNNDKALAALASAARSDKDALQDASTRILGKTMNLDAGPVLLDLAKTLKEGKYKVRAMRGYIRLVRQFNMPEKQRVEMCALALGAATRPDEKKMVVGVLERYPSLGTFKLAASETKKPELKADAARAAANIAHKISADADAAKKLLATVGLKPLEFQIVKAEYGSGSAWKDVTKALQSKLQGRTKVAIEKYNTAFGGDPAPGVAKQLKVTYRVDGKEATATFAENQPIELPSP